MRATLAIVVALVGCGGAARGSLQAESTSPSEAEGAAIEFPDEAARRQERPASEGVLEAETMLAEGRPLEARRALQAIVAAHPDDVRAWLDLGLAHELLEQLGEAEQAYRRAIEVDPTFGEGWNNLGTLLRDTDRVDEGITALREAVRVAPGLASAHLNLGMALEDSGDDAGAEAEYRRVMRLSRRDPASRTNLGLLLLRHDRRDEALVELRRAVPLASTREDLAALGNGLRRAGDAAMAVRVLTNAVEADDEPPPAPLLAELALAEFAAGHRDAARARLEALVRSEPRFADAHYLLGNLHAAAEAWGPAAEAYQAYLRAAPSGPHASEARERLEFVRSRR